MDNYANLMICPPAHGLCSGCSCTEASYLVLFSWTNFPCTMRLVRSDVTAWTGPDVTGQGEDSDRLGGGSAASLTTPLPVPDK